MMIRGTGELPEWNTEKDKCQHRRLRFGSGAFYIFCAECSCEWTATKYGKTVNSATDIMVTFDYDRGNSPLSGQERLDPWSLEYFNKVKEYLRDHPDV
ncbi:MAG TPA: hypothetical protein VNX68_00180, partial [Nitrosopumilaceae archaeon]|nr:hypothetical protein [Nitrosopumilaceae archaeon]